MRDAERCYRGVDGGYGYTLLFFRLSFPFMNTCILVSGGVWGFLSSISHVGGSEGKTRGFSFVFSFSFFALEFLGQTMRLIVDVTD